MIHSSKEVYIQDRNSGPGLVLEYNPQSTYEVTIQRRTGSSNQKWLLTSAGVAGYVFIQNMCNDYYVTAGNNRDLAPKRGALDLSQVWILCAPDHGTNRHFVIMSAKMGMVMDIFRKSQNPFASFYSYT